MTEIRLEGGSVSGPVRVGNTVRRIAGAWTPTVHALLDHLAAAGFAAAPRALGMDDQGREILSYLPGEAAHRPWPEVLRTSTGLEQAGSLLRHYHDVVAEFVPPPGAQWRIGVVPIGPGQIIRHGDLGPWNTLWQDGQLTGLLDWDFAEPGERITDLAQLAWYFVPLRCEEGWRKAGFDLRPDFRARLGVLARSYGGYTAEEILAEVDRLQHADIELTQRLGGQGLHPWKQFYDRGGVQIIRSENAWLKSAL